jgi:2-polyprenyl-3-methyl-5-hydroxy-6-metoxy-1,4-benzoquinol methylase
LSAQKGIQDYNFAMNVYRSFAEIYANGPYPGYSLTLIDLLPALFERLGVSSGGKLLDIACGEGSFSIALAPQGWDTAGIDQSPDMIELARKQAKLQHVDVEIFRPGYAPAFSAE